MSRFMAIPACVAIGLGLIWSVFKSIIPGGHAVGVYFFSGIVIGSICAASKAVTCIIILSLFQATSRCLKTMLRSYLFLFVLIGPVSTIFTNGMESISTLGCNVNTYFNLSAGQFHLIVKPILDSIEEITSSEYQSRFYEKFKNSTDDVLMMCPRMRNETLKDPWNCDANNLKNICVDNLTKASKTYTNRFLDIQRQQTRLLGAPRMFYDPSLNYNIEELCKSGESQKTHTRLLNEYKLLNEEFLQMKSKIAFKANVNLTQLTSTTIIQSSHDFVLPLSSIQQNLKSHSSAFVSAVETTMIVIRILSVVMALRQAKNYKNEYLKSISVGRTAKKFYRRQKNGSLRRFKSMLGLTRYYSLVMEALLVICLILISNFVSHLVNQFRIFGKIQVTQKGSHVIKTGIHGSGIFARLLNMTFKPLNQFQNLHRVLGNEDCLPNAKYIDESVKFNIFGILIAMVIISSMENIMAPLKKMIMKWFYPKPSKQEGTFVFRSIDDMVNFVHSSYTSCLP